MSTRNSNKIFYFFYLINEIKIYKIKCYKNVISNNV